MKQSTATSLALLLLPMTLAAYLPAAFAGYIWDDDDYVTENGTLRSASGLGRIWLDVRATPQYYPLVHTTYWLEYQLWGLAPTGYHIDNILLHGANATLLYVFLLRLNLPGAWLAAAIFALHPVHVESAAWITERKNVLCGLFYLASALCYLRFAEAGFRWPYALSLLFFVCALLSKTVAASLPAALLLVVWWQRGRVRWLDVVRLAPMFVIGIALGLLTVWLEKEHVGAKGAAWDLSVIDRCLIAGRAVWFYLGKLLWPVNLAFIYPRWHIDATAWRQYLYPAAALLLIGLLWLGRQRLGRGPLVAAFFFGGTLLPALGFFDIYPMVYSFVANHFQYLASIGPIALFAAWGTALTSARVHSLLRIYLVLALLTILGALTWWNCLSYMDAETLWNDTLRLNPECWMAHNNLGVIHEKRGEAALREANTTYERTEAARQREFAQANFQTAHAHYLRAIEIYPGDSDVWHNLGIIHLRMQKYKEAVTLFAEAVRLNPAALVSLENLGLAYYLDNDYANALRVFQHCLDMEPARASTHKSLGMTLAKQGRKQAAIERLEEALRLNPEYDEARQLLQQVRDE